jgi:hypothetical protein
MQSIGYSYWLSYPLYRQKYLRGKAAGVWNWKLVSDVSKSGVRRVLVSGPNKIAWTGVYAQEQLQYVE